MINAMRKEEYIGEAGRFLWTNSKGNFCHMQNLAMKGE
jgi:hypothetical protein